MDVSDEFDTLKRRDDGHHVLIAYNRGGCDEDTDRFRFSKNRNPKQCFWIHDSRKSEKTKIDKRKNKKYETGKNHDFPGKDDKRKKKTPRNVSFYEYPKLFVKGSIFFME